MIKTHDKGKLVSVKLTGDEQFLLARKNNESLRKQVKGDSNVRYLPKRA